MFNPDLMKYLSGLSIHLLTLGHTEDTLLAIKETVELNWRLAADHPTVFNPHLTATLNDLSIHLFEVGH